MQPQSTPIDMTGQRIGRLTVLRLHAPGTHKYGRKWLCLCQCGTEKAIAQDSLRSKHPTVSCGCFRREASAKRSTTHGQSHSAEHIAWLGLKNRCTNSND